MTIEERVAEMERKLADAARENDALKAAAAEQRKLADDAAQESARLRREKRELDVKVFCDRWIGEGIPPATVDQLRPLMMGDPGVVHLADGEGKPLDPMAFAEGILKTIPKVGFGAAGDPTATAEERQRYADEIALGDAIAAPFLPGAGTRTTEGGK